MKTCTERCTLMTERVVQLLRITGTVREAAARSGIRRGMGTVLSLHTTTGVTVNEGLECLESDMEELLERLAPEDHPYAHARMLHAYGSTAGNAAGHLKSLLAGNHAHFVVEDGEVLLGAAQEVYFCEFDGPACRTFLVCLQGEA